jgi:hypothetical protein
MTQILERIEQAYKYDQEHNAKPVTRRDELPIAFKWITPEWLTDVLCRSHKGVRVTDFKLGEMDDGTSNRCKIEVNYNTGDAGGLPRKLFCKAAHNLANRVVVAGIGCSDSESNFYTHIRPTLDIEAPVCYFAKVDPQTFNAMIVLKDLSDDVAGFCDHRTPVNKVEAESQLRLLARLHGKCYSEPALQAATREHFITWHEFFDKTCLFGMEQASEAGFRMLGDIVPHGLYSRMKENWPATLKSIAFHDSAPSTLAHHDVHLKNWYRASNGNFGLSDWQCTVRAHWSRDVAYAMPCSLAVEDRRKWERELLEYYLDQLAQEGGPRVDFADAWLWYRQQMVTALTWWTITINPAPDMPPMQPLDTTREFLKRIGTAMDDLGTFDAFR